MSERKAVYYGQVELIPGIVCDGYILNDDSAVMSERGTANLLDMDQKTLNAVRGNWPPKTLNSFADKDYPVRGNFVEVAARNSPHCGRKIVVYATKTIQTLIYTYASAFINDGLRKNQLHIGKRCISLSISLIRTALEAAIKEACGFIPEIQKTAQKHYIDAVELIRELGFTCTAPHDIATKQDISAFLKTPESTLNSYLYKHRCEIKPTRLDTPTIRSIGRKGNRMNGYHIEEVAKIAFGMDTEVGIEAWPKTPFPRNFLKKKFQKTNEQK